MSLKNTCTNDFPTSYCYNSQTPSYISERSISFTACNGKATRSFWQSVKVRVNHPSSEKIQAAQPALRRPGQTWISNPFR
ncbi:hypothetical protein ACFX14_000529 [Malus domestica]